MGLNKKDFLKISLITLILLGLIVFWLAFGDRGFVHLFRMEKERQNYLEKIRKLEKANQDLMEQINKLKEDKEYIEKMARKELGLVKEDEIIFRFRKDEGDDALSGQEMDSRDDE